MKNQVHGCAKENMLQLIYYTYF